MKIVDIAVKKVYRFNCPNCQSRLEADTKELEDIGGKVCKFYCPVCRKERYMTDLQRAIDTLVEVWEKFTASIKEMADALNKAFGVSTPEKEKKKSLGSPARYGMSLRKSRRESFVKQYSYRPIVQKHLPYQRRNY